MKGSKRWIDLYLLPRFQPIELVKPFLIICISIILSSKKYSNVNFKYLLSFIQKSIYLNANAFTVHGTCNCINLS